MQHHPCSENLDLLDHLIGASKQRGHDNAIYPCADDKSASAKEI
jgi:hypothetical protein